MPGLYTIPEDDFYVQVSEDGTNPLTLDGAQGFDATEETAPTRTVRALGGRVRTRTGQAGQDQLSIPILYNPLIGSSKLFRARKLANSPLQIRFGKKAGFVKNYPAPSTALVAVTTGKVTFGGAVKPDFSTDEFAIGQVLRFGTGARVPSSANADFIINQITGDNNDVFVIRVDGEAVTAFPSAAAAFKIIDPPLITPWITATVLNAGGLSMATEADGTQTMELQLASSLPLADLDYA